MTLGSLFAGIGGFELAATWAGIKPIWSNEINHFACKVLRKNFNHKIIENDIKKIGKQDLEYVDIISGGFPCQPFSVSGKQRGEEDYRNLWPEMFRIIQELHPEWVVGENVANLINFLEFEQVLFDLESEGYKVQSYIIPAIGVGAYHKRDRVWIIAHSETKRRKGILRGNNERFCEAERYGGKIALDSQGNPFEQFEKRVGEPAIFGVDNGIPNRMDRLGSLGNAIVPQIAYNIFSAILKQSQDD